MSCYSEPVLRKVRRDWQAPANRALMTSGGEEWINPRSLAELGTETLKRGDLETPAGFSRVSNIHRGPQSYSGERSSEMRMMADRVERPNRALARARNRKERAIQQALRLAEGLTGDLVRVVCETRIQPGALPGCRRYQVGKTTRLDRPAGGPRRRRDDVQRIRLCMLSGPVGTTH